MAVVKVNGKSVKLNAGEAAVILPPGIVNREIAVAARSVWTDGTGTAVAIISGAALKVLTGAAP